MAGWEDGETGKRFPIHRRLQELKNNKDLLNVAAPIIRAEWEAAIENKVSSNAASIKPLNNLLTKPELYERGLLYWPSFSEEAQVLIDQGVRSLTPDEYVRLNRLLLEGLVSRNCSASFQGVYCKDRPGYLLETFVSYWLKYFTDTSADVRDVSWFAARQILERQRIAVRIKESSERMARSRRKKMDETRT